MTLRRLKLTNDFAGAATADLQFKVRPGCVIKCITGGCAVSPGAGHVTRFYVMEGDYNSMPLTVAAVADVLWMESWYHATLVGMMYASFSYKVEIPVRNATLTLMVVAGGAIDATILNVYIDDGEEFAPLRKGVGGI